MSSKSKRKNHKTKKYFTAADANQMLPLVKGIEQDIVTLGQSLEKLDTRLSRLRKDGVAMGIIPRPQLEEEESAHEREVERLQECVAELAQLGIELKDVRMGLIDFPGWMDGR